LRDGGCRCGSAWCGCPAIALGRGSSDSDELLAPYRLQAPLSPAAAAKQAGTIIDPQHIRACYDQVSAGKDLVIVEGAGGLMVPLRGGYLMADLVRQLNVPLLVVARPVLEPSTTRC